MSGPLLFRPPVPFSANFHPAIEHVKQSPNIPLNPRAAAPAAACVAGRSRGQHMPPQPPSKQTATAPRPSVSFPSSEHVKQSPKPKTPRAVSPEAACVSDHSRGQPMPPQRLPVQPQKNPPIPPNPSCSRSRGGMRGWPLPRPTHAPATSPQNKRQQRLHKTKKTKRASILVASLQRRDGAEWALQSM